MIMFSDIGNETEYVLSVMTPPIALCAVTAETFIYGDDRIASVFGGGDEKRLPLAKNFLFSASQSSKLSQALQRLGSR